MNQNIKKLYLFRFLMNLHFIGGVITIFFTQWAGLSWFQMMFIQGWFMFWVFVLEVPTGAVADRWGRKTSLYLGAISNLIGIVFYVLTPNFWLFLLAEFFWSLAIALTSGSDQALVYDSLKNNRQTQQARNIFSNLETATLIGLIVAAPMGSLIAAQFGLAAPMLFMTIPFGLAFIVALTLKEPSHHKQEKRLNYYQILKKGFKIFHEHPALKVLTFDFMAIDTVAYFMIWLYQPLLELAGVDLVYFGIIHAGLVLSQILIMQNFDNLEKILGTKKNLITFSAFITGLMFVIGGLTLYLPLILTVIFLGGGFGLSRRPLFRNYLNKHIDCHERATVLSIVSMARHTALMIVNPLIGLLIDYSLQSAFLILGITALGLTFVSRVEEEHLLD